MERKEQLALFRAIEKDANFKKPPKYILRDIAIVYLLIFSGLRVSELCELLLGDITLSDRKGSMLVRKGKGDKERTVPINVEARRVLACYIEKREKEGAKKIDYLFIGQRGPITPHCVRHMLKKHDVNLKLNLHPHRLRHTFVRYLLDQQVPETDIIHMTGHKDFNALAPYGYPNQERLQSDVDRMRLS
ncbi:MAG: hypothetical protein VR67_11775 [Peptococcaceae bacterium BRH_c8a]|nr:MAG: hypothetical protein VR67_11775 [Peptococcaceae bacterium BRH_c8a]